MGRVKRGTRKANGRPGPALILSGPEAAAELKKIARAQDRVARQGNGAQPFRFRYQLVPAAWVAVFSLGLIWRWAHGAMWPLLAILLVIAAAVVAFTRHASDHARAYLHGSVVWACCWAAIVYMAGLTPWCAVGVTGWAVPAGWWIHRHGWHPQVPQPAPDLTAHDIWNALAARMKWHASLGPPKTIPNGRQYPIQCAGHLMNIGQITNRPDDIASAFNAPVTEAYAEPTPDGVKSTGLLTILKTATLEDPREWDRQGIDPESGLAVVGRFPDGLPVRERVFVPGVGGGVRHTLIAGADGTGKSALLDLGLCCSAISGLVAPVILDPQEGQALPAWRDHVPYACGPEECLAFLRGLHAAMFARSRRLAQLRWTHPDTGRRRRGMGFFDPFMTGLPIVEVTIDEAPVLLALRGAADLVLDIGKLGRKAGFRLRLAAQVPSIRELQAQELRSMLVGGQVFCFRTGDKVTAGMLTLDADPYKLPTYFRDGTLTRGLGYADTIDNRPGVTMRTDWEPDPYAVAETAAIRGLDDLVAGELAKALTAPPAPGRDAEAAILAAAGPGPGVPLGELIRATGCKVSEAAAAADSLVRAGKLRKDGGLYAVAHQPA